MNMYAVIILAALLGEYVLSTTASWLNVRAMSPNVPDEFAGVYDAERYAKSQEYTRVGTQFSLIHNSFRLATLLLFWQFGGFGWFDVLVRSLGVGPVATGLIYIGGLSLASYVIGMPFHLYSTFNIEERFGFNRTTARTFVADQLKQLILQVVIGGALVGAVLFFFDWVGSWAWLWCWLTVVIFMVLMQFVAPTWIMPLFNKFTPLELGELREAIMAYARTAKFPLDGLFVIDGSKRSTKANAFFTGFGKRKRIALYDTLIEQQTTEEVVAIVAHEVGHYKRKHVFERMALSIVHTGLMFWLLSFFLEQPALLEAFDVNEPSVYAALLFFGLLFTPVELALSVLVLARSRKNEFEADAFAVTTTAGCEPLVNALKQLSVQNLANLTPHPLTVMLGHSHPPLLRRIEMLRAEAAQL